MRDNSNRRFNAPPAGLRSKQNQDRPKPFARRKQAVAHGGSQVLGKTGAALRVRFQCRVDQPSEAAGELDKRRRGSRLGHRSGSWQGGHERGGFLGNKQPERSNSLPKLSILE